MTLAFGIEFVTVFELLSVRLISAKWAQRHACLLPRGEAQ